MNLGPHADFIIAAYAVTIFVIAALIAWVVLDYSAQRRILGDLEEHREAPPAAGDLDQRRDEFSAMPPTTHPRGNRDR